MIDVIVSRGDNTAITAKKIKNIVQTAGKLEPKVRGRVYIILVGKNAMRRLNKQFRNINKPTDVLSFAWHEDTKYKGDELGEVYLCPAVLKPQAKEWGVSYTEEFTRMLVHGLLHLAGYDHVSDGGAKKMFALQEEIIQASLRAPQGRRNPLT